jgi:hypothetical protein
MATPQHDPHNAAATPPVLPDASRGHEYVDLRLKGILIFMASTVVGAILIQIAVYALMQSLAASDASHDRPPSPLLARDADGRIIRPDPPAPLLQPYSEKHPDLASEDLEKMRRENDAILKSYGPAPSDPAFVHIPIQRAMDLVSERGLSVSAAAAEAPHVHAGLTTAPARAALNPEGGGQ